MAPFPDRLKKKKLPWACVVAAIFMWGCASPPMSEYPTASGSRTNGRPGDHTRDVSQVARSAEQYANRVNATVAPGQISSARQRQDPHLPDNAVAAQTREALEPAPGPTPVPTAPQIRWIDVSRGRLTHDAAQKSPGPPPATKGVPDVAVDPAIDKRNQPKDGTRSPNPTAAADSATPPPLSLADLDHLLAEVQRRVQNREASHVDKALIAVAVDQLRSNPQDRTQLDGALTATQTAAIQRYGQLLAALKQRARDGQLTIDEESIVALLREQFGEQPLRIRHADICRSVRGFGVYEPFENRSFIGGRQQTMIVYTEIDHFRSVAGPDQRFRVELAQEILLYQDGATEPVWREPRVDIVDESRNRRRDFFVVQMIKLPAQLALGQYHLKIRVTDLNGRTADEMALPLDIVADRATAQLPRR